MSNTLGNNGGRVYSSLVKPVLVEGSFIVSPSDGNGLGIDAKYAVKGSNVQDVFMYTSSTPGRGKSGILNPLSNAGTSQGYALIKLTDNYARYLGNFYGLASPTTGSALTIDGNQIVPGTPYIITSVGHSFLGQESITVNFADVAGNYASRWFSLYDNYGNTFIIWFSIIGVGGSAPIGVGGTLVQVQIAINSTAATIATAVANAINVLPSGIASVFSFTTGVVSNVVTVTSTQTNPYSPLPIAGDGLIPTTFTFTNLVVNTNNMSWQAVGVPKGVVPAVGVSFICTNGGSVGGGGSSGLVMAVGSSGVASVEVIGDPTTSLSPIPMGGTAFPGGWVLLKFQAGLAIFNYNSDAPVSSTVTETLAVVAPTTGTLVRFCFEVDASAITIQGD